MQDRYIRVKGKGTASVPPDCIQVELSLEVVRRDYERAVQASAELLEEIRDALLPEGLTREDIKTTSFGVSPHHERRENRAGRVGLGPRLTMDYSWGGNRIPTSYRYAPYGGICACRRPDGRPRAGRSGGLGYSYGGVGDRLIGRRDSAGQTEKGCRRCMTFWNWPGSEGADCGPYLTSLRTSSGAPQGVMRPWPGARS